MSGIRTNKARNRDMYSIQKRKASTNVQNTKDRKSKKPCSKRGKYFFANQKNYDNS
jgi:hypothetical protein